MVFLEIYGIDPLVNVYITVEIITMFNALIWETSL